MNIQAISIHQRQADGFVGVSVRVPEMEAHRLDISFEELRRFCGYRDPLALDFLLVASLCYVTDKLVERKLAADAWTREINVSLPVSDPQLWSSVAEDLARTLSFLTSDNWNFEFTTLPKPHWLPPRSKMKRYNYQANAVCLFSGGLDSLTGALDLLASEPDSKLLLVGHHDGAAKEQNDLYLPIRRKYFDRNRLLRVRAGHNPRAAPETTLRSRSFLFMALGIYAARSYGSDVPLYAPENGVIALNVPLTPSRVGACSTRTMHPFFLDSLREMMNKLGITNPIINPLEFKTKGECLAECHDLPLLERLSSMSVSCSHATRRQDWPPAKRNSANNCGYCVPCLFRRASMHRVGMDDGSRYGFDVCRGELKPDDERQSANDLRAMLDFLRGKFDTDALQETLTLVAPISESRRRAEMAARGFDEVRALIRDKGTVELQRAAGVAPTRVRTTP